MNRPTSRNSRKYHGLGGTPTYRTWYSMIDRCINPSNASFKHYGGRGVRVCDRWLSIENFVEDMGLRHHGLTIDRIDLSKGYEPSNCRWSTKIEQQRNKRNVRLSLQAADEIRKLCADGERQRAVACRFGVDQSVVSRVVAREIWL